MVSGGIQFVVRLDDQEISKQHMILALRKSQTEIGSEGADSPKKGINYDRPWRNAMGKATIKDAYHDSMSHPVPPNDASEIRLTSRGGPGSDSGSPNMRLAKRRMPPQSDVRVTKVLNN